MDLSFFSEENGILLPSIEELFDSTGAVSVALHEDTEEAFETLLITEQKEQQVFRLEPPVISAPGACAFPELDTHFTSPYSMTTPTPFTCEPSPDSVLSTEETDDFGFHELYTKKRKRPDVDGTAFSVLPSGVHLSRKILLEVSGEEYENHIKRIRLARRLTEEEELIHKEQRRLIRNREAASFSRAKKKSQIETLSEVMQKLDDERKILEKDVERLSVENSWLLSEVQFLSKLVEQSPALSQGFKIFCSKVTHDSAALVTETVPCLPAKSSEGRMTQIKTITSNAA